MVRFTYTLLLLAVFSVISVAQATPAATPRPDATALMQQIGRKYAEAQYYHIEAVEETNFIDEFSRDWQKSLLTAIKAPGNRYRFEGHDGFGSLLKVSDGKTETYYNISFHEYTRQAAPESGPAKLKSPISQEQFAMEGALQLLYKISSSAASILHPSYLPDENLAIGGEKISCYVIKGRQKYRGGSVDAIAETIVWIDKEKLVIRKIVFHQQGGTDYPHEVNDRTVLYPVMELDGTAVEDALFAFQPPADAELVTELSRIRQRKDKLKGSQAPAVTLLDANGKNVTLQDFHGKPVLLDFWATWCPPCVAALEPLKKLHDETADKGLTILSIDEDDEAKIAVDFFAKHGVNWPTFHDNGEIWRSFQEGSGVPFYVLIDGNGKIAFSKVGAKDEELRAAISKLGIDLPVKETAGSDKPKQSSTEK